MGVCGGPVGPRGAPVGPHGANSLCLTIADRAFVKTIKFVSNTTFKYHFPIPVNSNQKKVKYRYDTGKTTALALGKISK